jgi:hypothetical protein
MTLQELKDESDYISRACETAMAEEEAQEKHCEQEFKKLIQETIELGAGDEETALRWLTQDNNFYHSQDIESWVWDKGILFTTYGKELVKKLEGIVTFKNWEAA